MPKFTSPLEGVRVAAPCPARWEKMAGDERVRYCDSCSLHVYNLSGMTRREAEALVAGAEGRLCVRFHRRGDGTILTRDCPVGLRAVRRRVARVAGSALAAALGFLTGLGLDLGFEGARVATVGELETRAAPAPPVEEAPAAPPADDAAVSVVAGMLEVRGRVAPWKYAPAAHAPRRPRRGR